MHCLKNTIEHTQALAFEGVELEVCTFKMQVCNVKTQMALAFEGPCVELEILLSCKYVMFKLSRIPQHLRDQVLSLKYFYHAGM